MKAGVTYRGARTIAVLAHHFGDDQRALDATEAFMRRSVANFGNEWEMTTADIDTALANIGADG